jgi:hypothetical protein
MARSPAASLPPAGIASVNELRDKARFKSTLDEIFEAFAPRTDPSAPPSFIGAAYGDPLEHTTRKYVIDDILSALGWDLGRLTLEMVEEARVLGDSTLFLDYLGVNPAMGSPLAIVEAKAWAKPLVTVSDTGAAAEVRGRPSSHAALIAAAIEHCKGGGQPAESPVTLEWARRIAKLHQYVTTLHAQSGQVVKRLAITSGRWWVIFTAAHDIFVASGRINTSTIRVFEGREVIERSDEIFDLLARQNLIVDPPSPLQPTQLCAYTDRANVVRLYHALWIARRKDGAHFDAFPQINLYPSIVVERQDGQLLYVVDRLRERITVPHSYDLLAAHVQDVGQRATALLQAVNDEIGVVLPASPVAAFPGLPVIGGLLGGADADRNVKFLKSWPTPNEFLLLTGLQTHYLLAHPSINPCAGHIWAECHALHVNQRDTPIVNRSYEPASFFTTVELHHCAHRTIHDRHAERCHIAAFEEFLCCRACAFQDVCWTLEESDRLPCGVAAANAPTQAVATFEQQSAAAG